MKTRVLLFAVFTLALLGLASLVSVVFNHPPATREIIWLFYFSVLVSSSSLAFLVMYYVNRWRFQATPPWQSTYASVRYAIIFAVVIALMLVLGSHGLLNTFIALVIICFGVAAELLWQRRGLPKILRKTT